MSRLIGDPYYWDCLPTIRPTGKPATLSKSHNSHSTISLTFLDFPGSDILPDLPSSSLVVVCYKSSNEVSAIVRLLTDLQNRKIPCVCAFARRSADQTVADEILSVCKRSFAIPGNADVSSFRDHIFDLLHQLNSHRRSVPVVPMNPKKPIRKTSMEFPWRVLVYVVVIVIAVVLIKRSFGPYEHSISGYPKAAQTRGEKICRNCKI
jgi:hypothetical protein